MDLKGHLEIVFKSCGLNIFGGFISQGSQGTDQWVQLDMWEEFMR